MMECCKKRQYLNNTEFDACHICNNEKDMYREKKTNGDAIRSMTNDELSVFITGVSCGFEEHPGMCDVCDTQTVQHCKECWLDWLGHEVESDG